MSRKVCIGLVQAASVLGEKRVNVEKGVGLIADAAAQGAQIVVLPELFTTGYDLEDKQFVALAEKADGESVRAFRQAAKECGVYVQVGYVETRNVPGVIYNSVAFIDPEGKLVDSYAKSHLFAGERMHFARGDVFSVHDTEYGRFANMICYDIGIGEVGRIVSLMGAECMLVSSAWCKEDEDIWDHDCIARACDNLCFVAACNAVGESKHLHLIGKSKFLAPRGNLVSEAPLDTETVLVQTIDLDQVAQARRRCLYMTDRRPELYGLLTEMGSGR